MIMHNVMQELNQNSPPLQPEVSYYLPTYQERLVNWSGVGIKQDALFYQFKTPANPEKCKITLLPDACANVLVPCNDSKSAFISGMFLHLKGLELAPNTEYFGFKPYSILGLKAPETHFSELVDDYADFSAVFPDSRIMLSRLCSAKTFDERIAIFDSFAKPLMVDQDYVPGFIDYFTVMICSARGKVHFNNMAKVTGYSERYCREKFKKCYGLSPKKYSSIMRFQNVMKGLLSNQYSDMSSLACENGYFDQAHFIRAFKNYTNVSPDQFRKQIMTGDKTAGKTPADAPLLT